MRPKSKTRYDQGSKQNQSPKYVKWKQADEVQIRRLKKRHKENFNSTLKKGKESADAKVDSLYHGFERFR